MLRPLLCCLTFPGVVAHEFAHAWACRRLGIRVERVCYLRLGNPPGYVLHALPESPLQQALVCTAPFFLSSLLALTASLSACLIGSCQLPGETRHTAALLALWLGFSAGVHAFPSTADADALRHSLAGRRSSLPLRAALTPVVWLMRLARLGTRFWLDVPFALALVGLPPALLIMIGWP